MRRNMVVLLWLLPLLGGCVLHQPQPVAAPSLPDSYGAGSLAEGTLKVPERWWTQFDDPQLDRLLEQAFAGNLELRQALARLEQLQAVRRQTAAAQQPYVNLEASGGRVRQAVAGAARTSNSYRLAVAAGFELDLWRKLEARTAAAGYDMLASQRDLETLYLSLSAQLADFYYLAVEQRAQLELTDHTVAAFADSLARVEDRYRSGLVPAVDVYQARQNLAAAKSRRPQYERTLAQTEHALSLLLGRYPDRSLAGDGADIPRVKLPLAVGLPAQLLLLRPDIDAALARLKASDQRIGAAVAERFPSFTLTGSYGGASTELDSLLQSPNIFWNLLLNVTQPLLDGSRRQAEVDRSQAVFREQLAAYQQTLLRAFQEVEDALVQEQTSVGRIALLEERVAAAGAARRLALDRYLQGITDYLPVLLAQTSEFEAESQLLAARRQLVSDRIALSRALGGRWMEESLKARLANPPEQGSKR
ncbi:MAG: efflux transporter outer membrane subunit [Desulfuromonadaceae bacterium]